MSGDGGEVRVLSRQEQIQIVVYCPGAGVLGQWLTIDEAKFLRGVLDAAIDAAEYCKKRRLSVRLSGAGVEIVQ